MKIYVASSWRNEQQPAVVARLRAEGHEVYDFRVLGFSWKHCEGDPPPWSAEKTREVLSHARAQQGFDLDFDAMQWADTILMVQPCGRSAALELGWGCGSRKLTLVLLADAQEPELMLKCATGLCTSLDEVVDFLARWDPVSKTLRPAPGAPRAVVRFRNTITGQVGELVRPAAIEDALTLRFDGGVERTFFSGGEWERLP